LLVLAALVPLLILSAGLMAHSLRQQQDALERDVLARVQRISDLIEQELSKQIELVQVLANSPSLDGPIDVKGFAEHAKRVRQGMPLWRYVVLSDQDGNRLVDVPEPVSGTPGAVVEPPSHLRAVQTAQPVIGNLMRGRRNYPAFAIRAPVVRNGKVAHVVSAVVEPTAIRDMLFAAGMPNTWIGAVVDADGRIVARTSGPSSLIGQPASESARAASGRAPQGVYEGTTLEGVATVTAYRVLPLSRWSIHIGIPRELYNAPLTRSLWLMLAGAVLSALLAAVFVWLLARELRNRQRETAIFEEGRRLEALGQMTGGVAHDFNNLLMIVQGSADALRRNPGDAQRHAKLTDAILAATARGQALTRQLLAFARRGSNEPTTFRLRERVPHLLELLKPTTRDDINVAIDIPEHIWPVFADMNGLDIALVNLAVNARDAMPEGGRLSVSARNVMLNERLDEGTGLRGDYVAIAVMDTGVGIAPDQIGRVFEPFFTTKPAGKGTGLGLSQVYGFAKQSDGAITVASRPGGGTTFTLYLPRSTRSAAAADAPANPDIAAGAGHILLVEDNPDVAQVTEAMLVSAGYTVSCSKSARQALDRLAVGETFDVIVSDIVMEGMSGLELNRRVRDAWPHMAFVLMTGYSESLLAGSPKGVPVLSKPFFQNDLVEAIRAAQNATRETARGKVVPLTRP